MVDSRDRPPTGVIKVASEEDPTTWHTLVGDFELKIDTTYKGEKLTLSVSSKENPPLGPFEPKLTDTQLGGLWLITEGSVFPEIDGMPVWKLTELLQKRISNVSRDIIKPFEEWGLIYYKSRKSTRKGTANPNQPEKAFYLKKTGYRNVFYILLPIFNKHYFNKMTWKESKPDAVTHDNLLANKRFITLALLQKTLKEYENNEQYYTDLGAKPPIHLPKRLEPEKASPAPDQAIVTIRGVGPLSYHDEADDK